MKVSLLTISGLSFLTAASPAAISLGTSGYTNNFTTAPTILLGFSTRNSLGNSALPVSETNARIGSVETRNSWINANVTAANTNVAIGTNSLNLPGSTVPRHQSTLGVIQSNPSGNAASFMMLTVQNTTGAAITGVTVQYTLGGVGAPGLEQLPGVGLLFSLTGLADSWTAFADNTTNDDKTEVATFVGNVANNTNFFLLWAEDNADGGTEALLTYDNLQLTAIPEPSALVLSLLGLGAIVARRRR